MQNKERYQEGQAWNYKTRDNETNSKLYIVKIDYDKKFGKIYHIYIDNLSIKNPYTETGYQDCLPHSPVSEKTLDSSVLNIANIKYENRIDISNGYAEWRKAFDDGKAGVFTIPVDKITQYIEEVVNKRT